MLPSQLITYLDFIRVYISNAYLVNSNVLRAVRVGGNWNNGSNDGFSNVNANNAPSNGNANYGGGILPYTPAYTVSKACAYEIGL